MEVKIDKSFRKDTRKIKDQELLNKIAETILTVRKTDNINNLKQLKKLKGSNEHYRLKIGNYRIGLLFIKNQVIFVRCLHRKDIYKFFPKK